MNYVEVTCTDNGYTEVMSLRAFYKRFGKAEGKEILAGYLPNLVAIRVPKPAEKGD